MVDRISPYVDVTGKEAPVKIEKTSYERYCLVKEGQAKFPIDSYGQVQMANDWFVKYGQSLHPADRHEYCMNLVARAQELGIDTDKEVQKYGSSTYAPDGEMKVAVAVRKQYWRDGESQLSLLDGLLEKRASVDPDIFCEALRQFDVENGLDHYWDDGIYDPWYSTYGIEKKATWSFTTNSDRITEEDLKRIATAGFAAIKDKFGCELAEAFMKDPKQIFSSLPLDSKRIIMRLANDPQPSPLKAAS